MAFKIQSRAWRWKMSPSNISMTGEWSCGAVAAAVLLISMSLSTERVYVSAKHSWCQLSSEGSANTPQNIKTRQVWNLLLLLWLRLPIINLQPGKVPLAEMLLTWGQTGSTDLNHHPCSPWGCCCNLSPWNLHRGRVLWAEAACAPCFPRRGAKWQCGETSALPTFQLFLWAAAVTPSRCNPSLLPLYKFIFLVRKKNMEKIFGGCRLNWEVLNVKNEEGFIQHPTTASELIHTQSCGSAKPFQMPLSRWNSSSCLTVHGRGIYVCLCTHRERNLCLNLWPEQGTLWLTGAPAANSEADQSLKVPQTSSLGGFDHSKHVYASLWQLHSSHASLQMLSREGKASIFTRRCSPEGIVLDFNLSFGPRCAISNTCSYHLCVEDSNASHFLWLEGDCK